MEKIIPPGLNYANIKPEAIENQIRIIKYTPVATIQNASANDVIRFQLQGNGFYDPYSAYIRMQVQFPGIPVPTAANPLQGKFLDRSAHSLISRIVIRSQGSELERIDQYDVMAAMINDMLYSQEQRSLHHYEGFAHREFVNHHGGNSGIDPVNPGVIASQNYQMLPLLQSGAGPTIPGTFCDYGAWTLYQQNVLGGSANVPTTAELLNLGAGPYALGSANVDYPIGLKEGGIPMYVNEFLNITTALGAGFGAVALQAAPPNEAFQPLNPNAGYWVSPNTFEFMIPIYSGIIGVLMPDKKLLPLSLVPLEVEFYVNPYGIYSVGNAVVDRQFIIRKFEIWSHTLFFEQELHRSLEAVVAENGIFLHYNSFYVTPFNTFNAGAQQVSRYCILNVFLKSINSIHWTFLYNTYESDQGSRKLHFCCHNMSSLQLRNGMELTPSEPILGRVGAGTYPRVALVGGVPDFSSTSTNLHSQFLIETYKGWNKMHDPLTDGIINSFNYNIDMPLFGVVNDVNFVNYANPAGTNWKPTSIRGWLKQCAILGRCQYALSLEGEEIGQNKTILAGKKSVMPFDLNMNIAKTGYPVSMMVCFLRADFILYVRPDLVVTRLGL